MHYGCKHGNLIIDILQILINNLIKSTEVLKEKQGHFYWKSDYKLITLYSHIYIKSITMQT